MARIYLTKDEAAWIDYHVGDPLTGDDFNSLLGLAPKELSTVQIYNKTTKTHEDKKIFRRYRSYLNTPELDTRVKKSYMFSGSDGNERGEELPEVIKDFMGVIDIRYNQLVVNWYLSGDEYIEMHSDCDAKMEKDASILILSFSKDMVANHAFTLEAREGSDVAIPHLSLPLAGSTTIEMNDVCNKLYRHGVDKAVDPEAVRISLTCRMMKGEIE